MNDVSAPTEQKTVGSSVGRYVAAMQGQFLAESPAARGQLAELRKAVDETPGENPRVWAMVLESLPEHAQGRGDAASPSEWAAFTALTLYSVHQRGHSGPMHVPGTSFAEAVGTLVKHRTSSAKARYDAVLTATTFAGQRFHLRSLVGLLSTDGLGFDYGRFAADLLRLQDPQRRAAVHRTWGRQFYRAYRPAPEKTES